MRQLRPILPELAHYFPGVRWDAEHVALMPRGDLAAFVARVAQLPPLGL